MRVTLIGVVAAVVLFALPTSALAAGIGPPGGTIYAFDQPYRTVATPTSLPDNGAFDTIYVFPDCPDCASVSETAPGNRDYNGGRWRVIAASGITTQLTNAGDVVTQASSLVDTGTRFVCPLVQG